MSRSLEEEAIINNKAPLIIHLKELRKRLLYISISFLIAFFISYYFVEELYQFLVKPLAEISKEQDRKLIYTGLTEAFFTYISLAIYAAIIISFPFIASQIYIFLAPGLYKKEKKVIAPYLIAAPLLFLIGAAIAYYVIFPLAWKFFLSFETMGDNSILPIKLEARVSEYLSLSMSLVVGFGLAFQLPIIITLCAHAGWVKSEGLKNRRKFAIVGIFILAAFLTPPDVISQIGMALPLIVLYELSIFAVRMIERNKNA